jgi:thiamine biosynthesis lipoprotein
MPEARTLVQQTHRIMATAIELYVAVEPGDEPRAEAAMAECVTWLREVDAGLTRFNAESELCALNASGGTWFPASEMLFTVVELSIAAARATDGLFDPTLLPLLEAFGYDRDYKSLATTPPADAAAGTGGEAVPSLPVGTWRQIKLDRARRRIRLPKGTRLDLGGIAKGWAADVAVERYFEQFPGVIVSVGGDMRVRGGLSESDPWALGIEDPRDAVSDTGTQERHAAVLTVGRGGLATSAATGRWWWHGGERRHHLLDPRTRRPARVWLQGDDETAAGQELIASATALAPTAAQAEVEAKVALLRGYPWALRDGAGDRSDAGTRGAANAEGTVALLLVLGSGRVVCSENMQSYLDGIGGGGNLWLD